MEQLSKNRIMSSIALRQQRLAELGPMLQGTLVTKYQKCKSPKCPCHQGEKVHPYQVVSSRVEGHTQTLYVPVDMQEQVRIWIANYQKAKILLKEISDLTEKLVRIHAPASRAAARRNPPQD